jgi:hypothetical protein
MPYYPGSLIAEWRKRDLAGTKSAVLLIDESEGFTFTKAQNDPSPLTLPLLSNQGAILQLVDQFANAMACFIELNPTDAPTWIPTSKKLTSLVSKDKALHIPKQYFSAFDDTNLSNELLQRSVSLLVVMGHFAGQCVKQSIFGGARRAGGQTLALTTIRMGALNYGFEVLTTQSVVSGTIDWPNDNKVHIFAHI